MNIATLKFQSIDDATLNSLRSALNWVPKTTWKKGDPLRNGGLHPSSGFSFTIAEAANPDELLEEVRKRLLVCKENGQYFSRPNLISELSIGITVGDSMQFAICVELTTADLLLLAELGIHLTFWAYPTSDEANAGTSLK